MKRLALTLCFALLACGTTAAAGRSTTRTDNICVGGKPGCFGTIQAAVDAAHNGDTITIASGTFTGGVSIDVSVNIRGAGASATTIKGGSPVLSIGQEQATTEPTVSLSGVTITGGFNNSSPDHAVTQGGGLEIPVGSFSTRNGLGATVTITDSLITGNKVASEQLLPPGFCGPDDCSFATGGGIANAGELTLINTRVTDNQAGDPASITVFATGGGIAEAPQATLTLEHSIVTGNRSVGAPPHGVGAISGGIDAPGRLTIDDSVVSENSVELSSSAPSDTGPSAGGGGISVGGSATIARTIVHGNSVTASNVAGGDILAFSGGIQVDGTLTLSNSTVDHNQVTASIPPSSGNTVIAAQGGLGNGGVTTIRNSLINGNSVAANGPNGFAEAGGAGIGNFGQLTLERALVIANTATANGAAGLAVGAGINNFTLGGPPPQLTLIESVIAGNRASASPGITPQGAGLFTSFPVTLTRTVITGNKPDQCFGC
jgi:hypothetical protein